MVPEMPSECVYGRICTSLAPEEFIIIIIIWFVRLLALRPLLAYCASLG
jgi:hypothetical protein